MEYPTGVGSKFLGGGGRGGGWGGGRKMLEVGWWGSLRNLSKNILKQGVGKGRSCL